MKKSLLILGLFAAFALNAQTITFNGDGDGETWADAGNWDLDLIPTAAHDVVIPDGFQVKIKTAGALANTVTASGTGKVQINAEKSLTVTGNLTGGSNSNIFFVTANGKNMGTLIFGGTYTGGNTSAKIRLPNNNKWHLISPPLKQATIDNFVSDATTIVTNASSKYSLATYNDANAAGLKYTYFSNPLPNTTDKLEKGQGYATLLNNTGDPTKPDMQFKGKFNDADVFSPDLVYGGNGFVLLGNPFTAYVYANTNADATKNILTVNTGKLSEETIWLWDSTADSGNGAFVTKNQSSAAYHLSPGQGFFVKVKSTVTGKFRTNEDMQTHTKIDGFLRSSNNRFEIDLSVSSNNHSKKTSIKYIDNTSTSFDNGYDSSIFGGYSSEFDVFTGLISGDSEKKLAIQSLPNSDYDNMIIPVGVRAKANTEITFRADAINVPNGYNIYLEDRSSNTFTRLDELNSEYKVSLNDALVGFGRFYLYTTQSVLNIDENLKLEGVSIYKTNASTLRIAGLSQGNASISLFNLLGKKVMNSSFEANGIKDISLPKLAPGVYFAKLQTAKGKVSKKIILE